MRHLLATSAALLMAAEGPAAGAPAFSLSFEWGDIPLCTSGDPNVVDSPEFRVSAVPDGTESIRFRLTDLDVPDFEHGGGTVLYAGEEAIASGAFRYKSPCPPSGSHTYEWTATALDTGGTELAEARASKRYP
jgi:phosphatidylethanolamine-binding protein (PEBP) family uncharacterized protein